MIQRTISQMQFDKLVFENRNQTYGAYELRQVYNTHIKNSLIIVLIFLSAFTGGIYLAGRHMTGIPSKEVFADKKDSKDDFIEIILNPIKLPMVKIPTVNIINPDISKIQKVVTATNINYEVVKNDPLIIDKPEVIATQQVTEPILDPSLPSIEGSTSSTNQTAAVPGIEGSEITDNPLTFVQVMPEFNGNLKNYISSKLNYSNRMIQEGAEGRVVISFVVNKYGKITGIQVVRSIHPLLDAEAIRVIESMPDWKPGIQNDHPVNVRMSIPILFKLNN